MADDSSLKVEAMGEMSVSGVNGDVVIRECHLIPGLAQPLLSVPAVYNHGGRVEFSFDSAYIFDCRGSLVLEGYRQGNAWYVDLEPVSKSSGESTSRGKSVSWFDGWKPRCVRGSESKSLVSPMQGADTRESKASWQVWHARLGHLGWGQLKRLVSAGLADGMSVVGAFPETHVCDTCFQGKMHQHPFPPSESRASKPLELLHVDLCGPTEKQAIVSQSVYFMVVVDDYTRFAWVYGLKYKHQACAKLKELIVFAERQFEFKVKVVRTDNGGEFMSGELNAWFAQQGIKHEHIVPYTPQHNGVAERYNRTLLDRARSMLLWSGLGVTFWEYALRYANWLTNRLPTTALPDNVSPYSMLYRRKPSLALAKVFGCMGHVYVHPKEPQRKGRKLKFAPRARWGVFIGVSSESLAHQMYIPETHTVGFESHNVGFREDVSYASWKAVNRDLPLPVDADVVDAGPDASSEWLFSVPLGCHPQGERVPSSADVGAEPAVQQEAQEERPDHPFPPPLEPMQVPCTMVDEEPLGSPPGDSSPMSVSAPAAVDAGDAPREGEDGDVHSASPDSQPSLFSSFFSPSPGAPSPQRVDEPGEPSSNPPLHPYPTRERRPAMVFSPTMRGHHVLRPHAKTARGSVPSVVPSLKFVEPLTVKQCEASPYAEEWRESRRIELERLQDMGTWELVNPPKGANILGSKWVFKVKLKPDMTLERFKSRFVAQGCGQKEGVDFEETFAATAGRSTIRLFFGIVCALGLKCRQLDVTTAFLYGPADKEIYIRQPPGHEDGTGRVLKLFKSVYGLKQAPRIWQETLKKSLSAIGFLTSALDPSLYILKMQGSVCFLVDFVDDIILASLDDGVMDHVVKALCAEYKMTDMGVPQRYVGMWIHRDIEKGELWLHQAPYLLDLAEKYKVSTDVLPDTPLPSHFVLEQKWEADKVAPPSPLDAKDARLEGDDFKRFQKMVGALNYVAHTVRLDVAFAVNQLSRSQHFAKRRHLDAAEHCIRYLVGTANLGLHFKKSDGIVLECFADANFNANSSKKNMTGFLLKFAGASFNWTARRQDRVTGSTCDSECLAVLSAVQHVEHARDALEEFGCMQMQPTPVFNDNSATVSLCQHAVAHKKSVQLTRQMAYVRERTENGVIAPLHVRTHLMAADFLTKRLDFPAFSKCRDLAGLHPVPSAAVGIAPSDGSRGSVEESA